MNCCDKCTDIGIYSGRGYCMSPGCHCHLSPAKDQIECGCIAHQKGIDADHDAIIEEASAAAAKYVERARVSETESVSGDDLGDCHLLSRGFSTGPYGQPQPEWERGWKKLWQEMLNEGHVLNVGSRKGAAREKIMDFIRTLAQKEYERGREEGIRENFTRKCAQHMREARNDTLDEVEKALDGDLLYRGDWQLAKVVKERLKALRGIKS